jgi:DNA ligase-1
MLAKLYNDTDPTGYWASEKLDGVRCIYANGKLLSRNNNEFFAPKWFLSKLPKNVVLDGELYTKRSDFSNVMSIVSKNNPIDSEWDQIKYVVFDLPLVIEPFENRQKQLKALIRKVKSKHIGVIPQVRVQNRKHLLEIQSKILKKNGEGVMLRQPGSYYEHKRSSTLLKMKTFYDDEAVVLSAELGSGKYSNVMGKLHVKWIKGIHKGVNFKVGSGFDDAQRTSHKKLFPSGTIVKIKYFELTSTGKPRFPVFLGVRSRKDL